MKWIEKLILPVALAFVLALVGLAGQVAISAGALPQPSTGTPLPILMYHHILKEEARLNKYTISPDEFRADLKYLCDNGYTAITMDELIAHVNDGVALPEKPVMITFDDGYESFHEYAFPILKEFNCKAVFSVVGAYVDKYSQGDDHHICYSHSTWNQLAQMKESGLVEIQNHSYNLHTNDKGRLGAKKKSGESVEAYRKMLLADLGKLQDECKNALSYTPTTFTYPFGYMGSDSLPIIKEAGFKGALTCEEKVNYISGDEEQLYHLKRFNRPHNTYAKEILEQNMPKNN